MNVNEEKRSLLNSQLLEEMFSGIGQPQTYRIMEELYLDMEARGEELMRALEDSDFKTVRLNAHSLSSESGSFGLDRLSWQSKAIELACDETDYETVRKLSVTLKELISRSGQALKTYQPA